MTASGTQPQTTTVTEYVEPQQKSAVKIETNSKGMAQVKVTVVAGESEDEFQRIMDIALRGYDKMNQALGARANFS